MELGNQNGTVPRPGLRSEVFYSSGVILIKDVHIDKAKLIYQVFTEIKNLFSALPSSFAFTETPTFNSFS